MPRSSSILRRVRLFAQTLMLVTVVRVRLSTRPFGEVYAWVEEQKQSEWAKPGPSHPMTLKRIIRLVARTARFVPKATCLTRALATQILCARYGFETMLRVGVDRSEEGRLEAHAWVEYEGHVIVGRQPDLERYRVLPSLARVS